MRFHNTRFFATIRHASNFCFPAIMSLPESHIKMLFTSQAFNTQRQFEASRMQNEMPGTSYERKKSNLHRASDLGQNCRVEMIKLNYFIVKMIVGAPSLGLRWWRFPAMESYTKLNVKNY